MKESIIFGGGNIGRGFIGQLFGESGCRVTFVDVDDALVAAMNRTGSYHLQSVFNDDVHDCTIGPVRALHGVRDAAAVAEALATAEIGATAVGAGAIKYLVPNFVAGVKLRAARGAGPFNLILCENLKGAAAAFRQMVEAQAPAEVAPYLASSVGFVDTVIGRMVPIPTAEMRAQDPAFIRVEPYKELPVDRAGFVGPVPAVSAMTAYDNFPVYTARKLYLHNCGHALLAFTGYLRGHEFGWQALADPLVHRIMERGLAESTDGVVGKYGADRAWLLEHVADLLRRFGNRALGDTVFRLGRDPVRKLAPSDRLVGAARVAEAAGRTPRYLALGIAAALRFDPAADPVSVELQKRLAAEGVASVLESLCGIRSDEPLSRQILSDVAGLAARGTDYLAEVAGVTPCG